MYKSDIFFKSDPELMAITYEFAADNKLFLEEVSTAWSLLVNADMFDGPANNLCYNGSWNLWNPMKHNLSVKIEMNKYVMSRGSIL